MKLCKRATTTNEIKTYQSMVRVTVLGLICGKMTERVVLQKKKRTSKKMRVFKTREKHDSPNT